MGSKQSKEEREAQRASSDVWIDYCGGWGYQHRFVQVKTRIEQEFPGIKVSGATTGTFPSGEFKVVNVKSGAVYFDKKGNGDGMINDVNILPMLKAMAADFSHLAVDSSKKAENNQ